MNEKSPETSHQKNGNAGNHPGQPLHPSEHLHPDQELVYRLKSVIDQRGRYSFRLSDISAGFASGKEISNNAARKTIDDRFHQQLGFSPTEYLDRR